jgi:hypothetical protein
MCVRLLCLMMVRFSAGWCCRAAARRPGMRRSWFSAMRPVPDAASPLARNPAPIRESQPEGHTVMPRKSHPAAKPQAETPLTPARSFKDEDLTRTDLGFYRSRSFFTCPFCPHVGSVLARELRPGRGGLVKNGPDPGRGRTRHHPARMFTGRFSFHSDALIADQPGYAPITRNAIMAGQPAMIHGYWHLHVRA